MDSHLKKIMIPEKSRENEDQSQGIDSELIYKSGAQKLESENASINSVGIRRAVPVSFSQSPSKRMRLEKKPLDDDQLKKVIIQWKKIKLELIAENYNEHLLELFFLDQEGNLIDMQTWLKKPTPELMNFVKKRKLDGDSTLETRLLNASSPLTSPVKIKEEPELSSSVNNKSSSLNSKSSKKFGTAGNKHKLYGNSDVSSKNSQQDQMVEKARQEAYILQRITALRKDGLWGEKRLPKIQEAARPKAHWDYLLEEMVWLSADFAQERKWKKAAAKKCAKMVQKHFQDKALQAQKAEKDHEMKLRRIAAFTAKEVRTFWNNVEKLIEFKVNARLDEKKKKALDQQLSFIVGQTEKYSTMLAESMKKPETITLPAAPVKPVDNLPISDDEFKPDEQSDDDEGTIAKEDDNPEEQASEVKLLQQESELCLEDILKDLPPDYFENRHRDISLQESDNGDRNTPDSVVSSLSEVNSTDNNGKVVCDKNSSESSLITEGKPETKIDYDKDFEVNESEDDDEATIQEQEEKENDDYQQEIKELQDENEMSVEELKKKYEELAANAEPFEEDYEEEEEGSENDSDVSMKDVNSDEEGYENLIENDEDLSSTLDEEENLGLEDLLDKSFTEHQTQESIERSEKADKELQDASAVAESLQPKGFTLSSTSVTTPVPFLLKHKLREYQHVGLDWLVTMYEKKLNGILADEMGLGKTIQTIALLAHLACEKKVWGPHLIVVPTSVMLNWEMEFKKWCPAFKILTYYGSQKERKLKRQGWTKQNAFHICITSYKLVIQDHQSFRRKKWRYFILDEAQNIKNFKSQRWQLLLNFQSSRRLLLTGTPLQNSLMELWSLMHFLMPNIFASHREFREWFSNPVTGMIEGNKDYNESIIKRLHKVLRPFILRRLKSEVEQQMPKKFEHIIMCRLSKRQRFLYEEFMSRTKTKDTLASGNFLSVINILMQLRKVCNHPNLFEPRPTVSPFMMEGITYTAPSIVYGITDYNPFEHVHLFSLNLLLSELERCLTAFAAHRIRKFQAPQKLIQEIDDANVPPPRCPAGKIKLHVRPSSQPIPRPNISPLLGAQKASTPSVLTLKPVNSTLSSPNFTPHSTNLTASVASPQWQSGVRFQLVQHGGSYKAIPLPPGSTGGMVMQQTPQGPKLVMPQRTIQTVSSVAPATTSGSVSTNAPTGLQIVQTSTGQYLLTSAAVPKPASNTASSLGLSGNTAVALLQRLQGLKGLQGSVITTGAGGRPVLRLPTSSLRPNIQGNSLASIVSTCLSLQKPVTTLTNSQSVTPVSSPLKTLTTQVVSNSCLVNRNSTASPAKSAQLSNEVKESEVPLAKAKEEPSKKSVFYLSDLDEETKQKRKEKLQFMARLNTRRCHACPIYGSDLMEAVTVLLGSIKNSALSKGSFLGQGKVHCLNAPTLTTNQYWYQTNSLHSLVHTPCGWLKHLEEITSRYVFTVPAVVAPLPELRVLHPLPSKLCEKQFRDIVLRRDLVRPIAPYHHIINSSVTQFPDPRLIQYDCGKLQILDKLLRRLKNDHHRVLIFTQMTKMLDVFEAFLNFHGHLYLRLDGTTKVEQRQVLMERFNQDDRIFVFILSTRSGGIGVNLTGADTVIFYDSDWNPTMDAQAQDRCHRIGQTRDVHIYRLISEKTIEENILKKANQKRLLGDLAIEGGNFTTAQLKKQTIHDLFEVDVNEQDASKRMKEVLEKEDSSEEANDAVEKEKVSIGYLENALAAAEDEPDIEAARTAKAEAAAELAEFDENIPLEDQEAEEVSKAEQEVAQLMKQLTPIEKYAMKFLEESDEGLTAEAERLAAEIEQQKKEWEMGRLQAIQEEEERLREEENEELLTYSAVDSRNQVWVSYDGHDIMPIWRPPTPPQDENDLYVDKTQSFLYGSAPLSESCLPPVYIKRENNKRMKIESTVKSPPSSNRGMIKIKREDGAFAPRSLFDRKDPKREFKRVSLVALKPQSLLGKSSQETFADWLIHEDWLIVQAIQKVLQLPLNLTPTSHAHTTNWDLVADLVNSYSVSFRSLRQCKVRYENSLVTREENKETVSIENQSKKMSKKNKALGNLARPTTNMRGLGTFQLFQQDNNSKFSSLFSTRYETIKGITIKKSPTMKPMHINPASKNSKHAQILSDHGIQYEDPLPPAQVAANRAERIRESQKNKAEMAQQQSRLQIQHSQQQSQITVNQLQRHMQAQQIVPQPQNQHVAVVAASSCAGQSQQPVVVSTGCLAGKVATSVVLNQGGGNSLVTALSIASSTSSSTIVTCTISASTTNSTTATATIFSGVRAAVANQATGGTGRTTLTLQDLQGRPGTTTQATVVSMASLAQMQAAKLTAATLSSQSPQQRVIVNSGITGVPVQTRTLIPQQMQYLRQAQRQTLALHSGKVVATSTTGEQQTIKRVQIAGQSTAGQKVQVAVSAGAVPGITAIQMVKPGSVVAATSTSVTGGTPGKTVTRTVTESEMNALLRRQPNQLAKVGQIAQMLAKQRSLVGMKGATVGVQLGGKGGVGGTGLGTVQILQGPTQKHMTVQQFQQVFKQVQQQQQQQQQQQPQTIQQGTVVGKTIASGSGTISGNGGVVTAVAQGTFAASQSTKLIPVTVSTQQPIKQTIQVVSAGSPSLGAGTSNLRVTSGERAGITLQGNTVRVSNPALLSLGSAAFQGQPLSVAVKNSNSNSVRIQTTSLVAQQQPPLNQDSSQANNQQ